MSVLVVGSVALDSIETPHDKREEVLGGAAAYFASVASCIVPVRLVGVVGSDFPNEHVEFLKRRGVDILGLQRAPGKTFRWSGRYLPNMVDRETIDTQLNVFQDFRPVIPESYQDSEYVFLANIDPELQLEVLQQVQKPRLVACDTMNFWLDGDSLAKFRDLLQSVDIAFFNDEEARIISGHDNLIKAAASIRLMGPRYIVVKRGDAGAMLFADEGPFWTPAYPLDRVVDPTGAGDCFAGGVISYLAYKESTAYADLRQAMVFGSVTASFAVEAFSNERLKTLERDEIMDRCDAFSRLVHFERIVL